MSTTVQFTYYESDGLGDPVNPLGPADLQPGDVVFQWCIDTATSETVFSGYVTIGNGGGAPPIDPLVLAQHAKANLVLPLPRPVAWPGIDRPQTVGVATWLHVDNFVGDQRSATAGNVTATVYAVPQRVTWNMGDGGTVVCTDGGAVYAPGATTNCSYLFTNRSTAWGDGAFHGSVTITWHLRWESNTGRSGDLGDVSRTTGIAWTVQEIQAVIR